MTKEEMAREWVDKERTELERNEYATLTDSDEWQPSRGFIAGYDAAIAQASGGFEEWAKSYFGFDNVLEYPDHFLNCYQAARLSAQKDINKLIDCAAKDNQKILDLEYQLEQQKIMNPISVDMIATISDLSARLKEAESAMEAWEENFLDILNGDEPTSWESVLLRNNREYKAKYVSDITNKNL